MVKEGNEAEATEKVSQEERQGTRTQGSAGQGKWKSNGEGGNRKLWLSVMKEIKNMNEWQKDGGKSMEKKDRVWK